jgi:hypothetical protein
MQSLPTAVSTEDLNTLLSALEQMPSAQVNRHADIVTVTATRRATGERVKVLSAATQNGKQWHVMAVPGLITATATN